MREIVLDTETTGFDPKNGDRIVEIGCVELLNHIPTGETWHKYINPERDMPKSAFEVHGLSAEFLSSKPLFTELADEFLTYIEDATLVIHNASFDIGFLNAELTLVKLPVLKMDRVIDTLALARRKHPGGQNSLDALCRRYQIDNSSRTKHGALLDSEILAQVYAELIGGHQTRLELKQDQGAAKISKEKGQQTIQRQTPLPPRLADDELAQHKDFVETLGANAIWNRYTR